MATPFKCITIGQATADLPNGFDARATSVCFPDHRLSRLEDNDSRMRIACIPRFPSLSSIVIARAAGLVPQHLTDGHPSFWTHKLRSKPGTKAWTRASSDALLPTVVCRALPGDAFTGRALHWEEERCLTILEVRRAQGFPDHEVIVGLLSAQFKLVSNSVARAMALVLGMSLRTAWLANAPDRSANVNIRLDTSTKIVPPSEFDNMNDIYERNQETLSVYEAIAEKPGSRDFRSLSTSSSTMYRRKMMVVGPQGRKTTGDKRKARAVRRSMASGTASKLSIEKSSPRPIKAADLISVSSGSVGDEEVLQKSFSQQSSFVGNHIVHDRAITAEAIRYKRLSEITTTSDHAETLTTAPLDLRASSSTLVRGLTKRKILAPSNTHNPLSPQPKTNHRRAALKETIIID